VTEQLLQQARTLDGAAAIATGNDFATASGGISRFQAASRLAQVAKAAAAVAGRITAAIEQAAAEQLVQQAAFAAASRIATGDFEIASRFAGTGTSGGCFQPASRFASAGTSGGCFQPAGRFANAGCFQPASRFAGVGTSGGCFQAASWLASVVVDDGVATTARGAAAFQTEHPVQQIKPKALRADGTAQNERGY